MPKQGEAAKTTGALLDFWFGLGLVALGIAVTVESWRMPRFAELNVHPMTAPGLVPGLLGVVILLLGGLLFIRAARAGGWRISQARSTAGDLSAQARRFVTALILCVGYAAGLVGWLPFWAATFLFIFVFIVIFEWQVERPVAGHLRAGATAALQAALASAAVTYVFESVFYVRLP